METMVQGAILVAVRQAAAGVVVFALGAVVISTVAWVLAAGFRSRRH